MEMENGGDTTPRPAREDAQNVETKQAILRVAVHSFSRTKL
jgi:hypothetical protein